MKLVLTSRMVADIQAVTADLFDGDGSDSDTYRAAMRDAIKATPVAAKRVTLVIDDRWLNYLYNDLLYYGDPNGGWDESIDRRFMIQKARLIKEYCAANGIALSNIFGIAC